MLRLGLILRLGWVRVRMVRGQGYVEKGSFSVSVGCGVGEGMKEDCKKRGRRKERG